MSSNSTPAENSVLCFCEESFLDFDAPGCYEAYSGGFHCEGIFVFCSNACLDKVLVKFAHTFPFLNVAFNQQLNWHWTITVVSLFI